MDATNFETMENGTVVEKHAKGTIRIYREGGVRIRFEARTKSGKLVGTSNNVRDAVRKLEQHGRGTYLYNGQERF